MPQITPTQLFDFLGISLDDTAEETTEQILSEELLYQNYLSYLLDLKPVEITPTEISILLSLYELKGKPNG
jgi:hypothetical protein